MPLNKEIPYPPCTWWKLRNIMNVVQSDMIKRGKAIAAFTSFNTHSKSSERHRVRNNTYGKSAKLIMLSFQCVTHCIGATKCANTSTLADLLPHAIISQFWSRASAKPWPPVATSESQNSAEVVNNLKSNQPIYNRRLSMSMGIRFPSVRVISYSNRSLVY